MNFSIASEVVLHNVERERSKHMEESRILRELSQRPWRTVKPRTAAPVSAGWFSRLPRLGMLANREPELCGVDARV